MYFSIKLKYRKNQIIVSLHCCTIKIWNVHLLHLFYHLITKLFFWTSITSQSEKQRKPQRSAWIVLLYFIFILFYKFAINKLTDVKKLNINYTQWLEWPHRDIISNNGVPQHAKRTTLKRDKYLDVILINRQTNALPRYAHRPQPPELKGSNMKLSRKNTYSNRE